LLANASKSDKRGGGVNIVLTGFMGTGKTAVGRHVADKLRVPFVDVDAEIVKKAGKSVQEIFSIDGEDAFRKLESLTIAEIAARDKTVIATGGGALIDSHNRKNLESHGLLVCLKARTGTLLERLKDDLTRPLLSGENLDTKMERLMKERQSAYDLCPIQVQTDGKTITQVADEIIKKVLAQWH
jgi:shikimate kinase